MDESVTPTYPADLLTWPRKDYHISSCTTMAISHTWATDTTSTY